MRRCPPEATVEMRLEDMTWGVAQKATALVQPHQLPALACFLDRLWQVRLKNLEQVLSERLRVDDDAQAIAHVRRKHLNSSADVEQRRRKTFGIDLIQQLCTLIFIQRIVHHPREAKSCVATSHTCPPDIKLVQRRQLPLTSRMRVLQKCWPLPCILGRVCPIWVVVGGESLADHPVDGFDSRQPQRALCERSSHNGLRCAFHSQAR
mmetsp:Transcript_14/g.17  ORF Transcript_14/g.17 Transcript_14/m.17 type:complete len:207 (+) Transcript_14:353-973(+)